MPAEEAGANISVEGSHMTTGDLRQRVPVEARRGRAILPTTRMGKWAVGLAVANIVLMFGWRLMGPLGGFPGLAAGFAGGVVALFAITRRGERAVAVFAAIVPLVLVVVFVLAELLVGHD